MPKLTVEDLHGIKEEYLPLMNLREGRVRATVTVHMDSCGIAAGARKVAKVLLEEVESSGTGDVAIVLAGCSGACAKEPVVAVRVGEGPVVHYECMDPEKARKVFREHIVGGKAVELYLLRTEDAEGGEAGHGTV